MAVRYTFADVVRAPDDIEGFADRLRSWWADWPCRRRSWWDVLFRYPGMGWLRWGMELEFEHPYNGESYDIAPPLRRLWECAACILHGGSFSDARGVRRVLRSVERKDLLWT